METIKDGIELPKKRRGRPHKNPIPEIAQTLEESEVMVPDWKVFNIKEIADINLGTSQIINLKHVKTSKTGEKYIVINGRKYYEYNGEGEPKDSMYVNKGSSLFIGDKFEGLTNRDGTSFRYSRGIGENIIFEQRKTKYAGGAMHLKEIYKSENLSISEVLTIVRYKGKLVKITKNMLDNYIKGGVSKTEKDIIEAAIGINSNVFAYIQEKI